MIKQTHRPFRAVLFDLDDTLYDRGAAFTRWADDYLRQTCGLREDIARSAALARIAAMDAGGYGSKKAVLEEMCRLYPSADGTTQAKEVTAAFYEQFLSQLVLDGEAVEVLAALDEAGVPWGVVTNGQARQWRKLEQLGLIGRTPCLFVSNTFGCEKPSPAIFLAAAHCLGVEPAEVLFVGDHPFNDILGARGAGMATGWLHRDKPWPVECGDAMPDLTLSSLAELLSMLKEDEKLMSVRGCEDQRPNQRVL